MTKENSTEIVFIVDRSGSMSSIAKAMEEGFDEFIGKQRAEPGECKVTLVEFDDKYDVVYTARPISDVKKLVLLPRGMTSLYDAIGKTVQGVGERLAGTPVSQRPEKVLVVIVTDGHENSSEQFKGDAGRQDVFNMIKHQTSKYSWEFIFLGANQDSIGVASSIGISATNAVSYNASVGGAKGLMRGLSNATSAYRNGTSQPGALYDQVSYNAQVDDADKIGDAKINVDDQGNVTITGTKVVLTSASGISIK